MLNPCFKDKFFSGTTERDYAKELLEDKVAEISLTLPTTVISQTTDESEPLEKRARTEVMKCLDDILKEAGASLDTSTSIVDQYLAEPTRSYHGGNAYAWWADNKSRYPSLSTLVQNTFQLPQQQYHQKDFFLQRATSTTRKGIAWHPKGINAIFHKDQFSFIITWLIYIVC